MPPAVPTNWASAEAKGLDPDIGLDLHIIKNFRSRTEAQTPKVKISKNTACIIQLPPP